MLVDLPNWVGDQMMTMPALSRLVEANRGGVTVLHTRPNMLRFLSAVFPTASVLASPLRASPLWSARKLRSDGHDFEIGVTLRNSARAKILLRLTSRWSVGSRGEGAKFLLSAPCPVDRGRHQVHDADGFLAVLGLDSIDPSWQAILPESLMSEGETVIRGVGADRGRTVGLAPSTARGASKRWPSGLYGQLATRLRAHGYNPVVVIGPGEMSLAERVGEASGHELPVIGHTEDVAGLAAAVACLPLLVGNDSGPVQLAACLGIPVVAIFGPSDPRRTAPLGSRHRVVSPPPAHRQIRYVSVDAVEEAVLDLSGDLASSVAALHDLSSIER
jgi:heptosyltransferase-2